MLHQYSRSIFSIRIMFLSTSLESCKTSVFFDVMYVTINSLKIISPLEALANFRWIGPVPEELQDLTWIKELLIAQVHVCGSICSSRPTKQPVFIFWHQMTCTVFNEFMNSHESDILY